MRFIKIIIKSFLYLSVIFLCLALLIVGGLKTTNGQKWATSKLLALIEQQTNMPITLESVDYVFPLQIRLNELTLYNQDVPALNIKQLDLSCLSTELLDKRLVCSYVGLTGVKIFPEMMALSSKSETEQTSNWEATPLPVYFKIKHLLVDNLTLDPALIARLDQTDPMIVQLLNHASFRLEGMVSNNPAKSALAAHLVLTATDTRNDFPPLSLAIDTQNNQLSFSLHLTQLPLQLLPASMQNLNNLTMDLAYYAAAPLRTWQHLLENKPVEAPVQGNFNFFVGVPASHPFYGLTGEQARLKGRYHYQPDSGLDVTHYSLKSAALEFDGTAHLDQKTEAHSVIFEGAVPELAIFKPFLKNNIEGQLLISGELFGALQSPSLHLQMQSDRLLIQKEAIEGFNAFMEATTKNGYLNGTLSAALSYKEHPFKSKAVFSHNEQNPDTLQISKLEVVGLEALLNGQAAIFLSDFLVEGQFKGTVPDLSLFTRLASPSMPLKGRATFAIDLYPELLSSNTRVQGAKSSVEGQDIQWNPNLKAHSLSLFAETQRTEFNTRAHIKLRGQEVFVNDIAFNELSFDSSIDPAQTLHPFRLEGNVQLNELLYFKSDGIWSQNEEAFHLEVNRYEGRFGAYTFSTQAPFYLNYEKEKFELASFKLFMDRATLQFDGAIDKDSFSCQCRGEEIPSSLLHAFSKEIPFSGAFSFTANAGGPLDHPTGDVNVFLHQLQLIEKGFEKTPTIEGHIDVHASASDIQFKGSLNGIGNNPITAEGVLPIHWSLKPFAFEIKKEQPLLFAARAEGEIAPYIKLFGEDSFNLNGQTRMDLHVQGTLAEPRFQGHFDLRNGMYEDPSTKTQYKNIDLSLEGNGSQVFLKHLSASDKYQGSFSATGSFDLDPTHGYPFELAITQKNMSVLDSEAMTLVTSGHLLFKGNQSKTDMSGQLAIDKGLFRSHTDDPTHPHSTDIPFFGNVSFTGQLEGTLKEPLGKIKLQLDRLQVSEEALTKIPPVQGEINLNIASTGIQFDGLINGVGKSPIKTKGSIPVSLSLYPFNFNIEKEKPLEVMAQAEGELAPFIALFYSDATNLSGQTKIDLGVRGTFSSPQLAGYFELSNGSYESFSTGGVYKNIQARVEGNGTQLALRNFSAVDNKNGALSATGFITLDARQNYPFEVQIQPKTISLIDSDFASVSMSGTLVLKGNQKQSRLAGQLNVDKGVVHIGEGDLNQVKTVDVTYVNIPEGQSPPQYTKGSEGQSPIELDVTINTPNNISIEGKNLKSNWRGTIILTGSPQSPLLAGDLRVVDGGYNLNGKLFKFTQGNIHFGGAPSKKTTLYVVASREIDRITAEVIMKGSTENPVFSFRSNPPLSEREVLSYILFNRGISDITADQGNQLTQSFITLSSSSGSSSNSDFLTRLRNNIGIDQLDFSTGDSEGKDISLQVGKYISPGVHFSVNKSLNDLTSFRGAIEADVWKNIKAQAEMGVDGQSQISLKWKKTY